MLKKMNKITKSIEEMLKAGPIKIEMNFLIININFNYFT